MRTRSEGKGEGNSKGERKGENEVKKKEEKEVLGEAIFPCNPASRFITARSKSTLEKSGESKTLPEAEGITRGSREATVSKAGGNVAVAAFRLNT